MILRRPHLPALAAPITTPLSCASIRVRSLHHQIPLRPIPAPTPFIPTPTAFLTAIGRGLSAHASKFPSWDALFTLSSPQLKDLGIEPARTRKYLLTWRERFRNGVYGPGGDCRFVSPEGVAELALVEAPVEKNEYTGGMSVRSAIATATHAPGTRKVVVNVPVAKAGLVGSAAGLKVGGKVQGVKGVVVKGAKTIQGPWVEMVKGSQGLRARIRLQEGIWEVRRGHKIDGGERRQAEVRAKRRAAENKENLR